MKIWLKTGYGRNSLSLEVILLILQTALLRLLDFTLMVLCFRLLTSKKRLITLEIRKISTPIGGRIDYITVVNEHQKVKNLKDDYEVWLTRGIIFSVDGREISFEKDNVPFSEEIIIRRGYNLLEKFTDVNDFLEGWEKGILAECHREVIEMKN